MFSVTDFIRDHPALRGTIISVGAISTSLAATTLWHMFRTNRPLHDRPYLAKGLDIAFVTGIAIYLVTTVNSTIDPPDAKS